MKIERFPESKRAKMSFTALVQAKGEQDDECVRVTQLKGHWGLEQANATQVSATYETFADPAGDIPSWLANAFVVDQPYYTLIKLRNLIAEAQ